MSGSGSREGFGSPPWNPAEPVPELENTQALPGLGEPGAHRSPGQEAEPDQDPDPDPAQGRSGEGAAGTSAADDGTATEDAGEPPEGQPGRKRARRRRSLLRELPVLVVVALGLALLIKTYAFQAFYIPSSSMEKTLEIGDRVLVNKLVYDFRGIHRGDIVVFNGNGSWNFNPPASSNVFSRFFHDFEGVIGVSNSNDIYIKRVIGLPGDHVACCDAQGRVTVNGIPLSEKSYIYPGEVPSVQRFNITVPAGRLWVMGDHRLVSYDSRGHMGDPGGGTIPESAVIGRAFVIIWPPSQWGFLNIPATFEQPKLNASAASAGGSSAALAAAMDNGTPLRPSGSPLPLTLGFAGAVPLTWLQVLARRRLRARRTRRRREARRASATTKSERDLQTERAAPRERTLPSDMVQHGYTPRRSAGLAAYENVLARAGLAPVAGIDEAGRGACAGPLVVAAVVLDLAAIRRMPQLADSKLLTPAAREDAYAHIVRRAVDWHVVTIPASDIDRLGLHVCNVEGMRRAFAGLRVAPGYVLTDGFPVRGLVSPALAVWKGDRVAASVAAASIVAKVTRDRMMRDLDKRYPHYGFCRHKGYVTDEHLRALAEFGPCPEHRRSFRCVPEQGQAEGE